MFQVIYCYGDLVPRHDELFEGKEESGGRCWTNIMVNMVINISMIVCLMININVIVIPMINLVNLCGTVSMNFCPH